MKGGIPVTVKRTLDSSKVKEAARAIIMEEGFNTLTFKNLAKRLDIRSQSLYNYYHNLDDLLEQLGADFMAELYRRLVDKLPGLSGKQALRVFAQTSHEFFDQQGPLVQLVYYLKTYANDTDFVKNTERVLKLLRQLVNLAPLETMRSEEYVDVLISSVFGYSVLEIMGLLKGNRSAREESFQRLINLQLREVRELS